MPLKSRVAWFLRLKDLLRFPRHFVAPTRSRFRYRAATSDEHSMGVLSIIHRTTQPNAAMRSVVATPASSPPERLAYSILPRQRQLGERHPRGSATEVFLTRPGATAAALYQRSSWRHILDSLPAGRHAVETTSVREATPSLRANRIVAALRAPSKYQRLNADPHHKTDRLPPSRQVAFPARPIVKTSAMIARSMAPRSGGASADRTGSAMTTPPSDTAASIQPPQEAAEGRHPTARHTLHIDGQALGRWTIQHLERALGRPSAGMTGVDPRLSTPRSRISPF